jgi:hypothetical protein
VTAAGPIHCVVRRLPLLVALLIPVSFAWAHRLDEYLQATLVLIEPDSIRLQINLTPGVAIADQVLAQIDRNHDGVISPEESAAYADALQRDLTVRLDHRPLNVRRTALSIPAPAELESGSGIIQVEFSIAPVAVSAGRHQLQIENRHLPAMSVYLLNAAQPRSQSIQITRQQRNLNQSTGEIEFSVNQPAHASGIAGLVALVASLFIGVIGGLWRTRKR